MPNPTGTTTAAVKLRAGPGTQHAVLAYLNPKTEVHVVGGQDEWLQVRVSGKEGYVHSKFVLLADQEVAPGFLHAKVEGATQPGTLSSKPAASPQSETAAPAVEGGAGDGAEASPETVAEVSLAEVPLPPPDAHKIMLGPNATGLERLAANTWNRFGGLLTVLSTELKIDPAVAVAVLAVESGGRGFGPDGRLLIRFENHIFHNYWGRHQPGRFDQHFRFNPDKRWTEHQWRPGPDQPWRDFHGNQTTEWEVFEFARTLSDTAAKLSISMGGPQIMGFNYALLGFESVHEMFAAFAESERNQVIGFFDFVQGPSTDSRRVLTLQTQDFEAFASMYNGPGQAVKYGSLIRSVVNVFHALKPV